MRAAFRLANAFDVLFTVIAAAASVGVLQTFLIGRHFIIPTGILLVAVLCGNLAWYGFRGAVWAKTIMFWAGVLLMAHFLFALFWAKRYREWLGGAFEPTCIVVVLLLGYLTWQYARRNRLFAG